MMQEPIIIETSPQITHSIIWLHGLGADGHDFAPIVSELKLPKNLGIRFIFPHAPIRPVTLNGGIPMPAWFDIHAISERAPVDRAGILQTETVLHALMAEQIAQGIAADHLFLAGFSQGGAMALFTGLRYEKPLAGILGLSTFLPLSDQVLAHSDLKKKQTPVLLCHGEQDSIVSYALGLKTYQNLLQNELNVQWLSYAMPHTVCATEIGDIAKWLVKHCQT